MDLCDCGEPIRPPDPDRMITTAGGWCAPSEALYELPLPRMCSDCTARMLFIAEIGFDPGKNGENLRTTRGGIRYGSGGS